jgi:hypothetical protein
MTYALNRLLQLYVDLGPEGSNDPASLVRWCQRIETYGGFKVAQDGWTFEQAGTLADEVRELFDQWKQDWVTWVVETTQPDGTVITRQIPAPTYELALQFAG